MWKMAIVRYIVPANAHSLKKKRQNVLFEYIAVLLLQEVQLLSCSRAFLQARNRHRILPCLLLLLWRVL